MNDVQMNDSTVDQARELFAGVVDPIAKENVVRLGMIGELSRSAGCARIELVLPSHRYQGRSAIREALQDAAGAEAGIEGVQITERVEVIGAGRESIPGIKNVIAVASGKGGVGKSTLAANLAVALAGEGAAVGLLDCDVYGPSMPTLMGEGARPSYDDRKRIRPGVAHGVAVISMGYLVPPDTPMVWRGPMLHGALTQFLSDVSWGARDYLVLDLPPGTGDIQLTLSQQVEVAGALIVTTPQEVALEDVERGKTMFDDVQIETLGVVENMSYFVCPKCDKRHEIFGHGVARKAAERLGVPFLGEIPIDLGVRVGADEARPMVARDPDAAVSVAISELATAVTTRVAARNLLRRLGADPQPAREGIDSRTT